MRIAITVDIERDIGFTDSHFGIDEGLPFLLEVFRNNHIQATLFISGKAVDYLQQGHFLQEITRESHEVASHGYAHTDYRDWSYQKIREEICRSKKVLEDATGQRVKGFRAPQFLISEKVVRAVKECGFLYDSSLPDVSGVSAARLLRRVHTDTALLKSITEEGLREFTIDSIPVLRVPHGLLWINLISLKVYKLLFSAAGKDPYIFFMHPFDLIHNKSRVPLDFKRKIFYLKNQTRIYSLLEQIIQFWRDRGIEFIKLEDAFTKADQA
jgi:peptidoglycan/xylan/chitin deacetylase (PgdA/CDA1 family)